MSERTCPKCGTIMVEDEGAFVDVDDPIGKKIDIAWQQGLVMFMKCPKCGFSLLQDGHFGDYRNRMPASESWLATHNFITEEEIEKNREIRLKEIPQKLWQEVRGFIIESLVEDKYKEKHNIVKLTSYSDGKLCLNEGSIKACLKFDQKRINKILDDIRDVSVNGYEGLPDFLFVEKGNSNIFFFVECKSLDSFIPPKQRLVFERLEKSGYIIVVAEMKVWVKYIDYDRFPALINWRDKLN